MNLAEVHFPVFRLSKKPITSDGVLFFVTETFDVDSATYSRKVRIVDDKNIPHTTLSRRRLALKEGEAPLHRLHIAIFGPGDLIRLSKKSTWWIDSAGTLFQYHKTAFVPLVCKPIKKILPAKTIGCIVEVEGIGARFKTIFRIPSSHKYAMLLKIGSSYAFYATSEQPVKNSKRKV